MTLLNRDQTQTELLVKSARLHPKGTLAVTLFFPVFFGCFSFPLVNFSRILAGTWTISITPVLLLWVLYDLGVWAAARFPRWGASRLWLLLMGLNLAGMGGRLLLEWGEVSISTDFTLPNLLIHLGFFGVMFLWGIREAKKVP